MRVAHFGAFAGCCFVALFAVHLRHQHRHAACVAANSHSQFGEDAALLPLLLHAANRMPGTFVELGALDGTTFSNTLLLERCYNWTGLLIEANAENYEQLQRAKRKAVSQHYAVCEAKHNNATVRFSKHGGAVSALLGTAGTGTSKSAKFLHETVQVPCKPLRHLMASAGLRSAHFLSLDVEGAEEIVLSTVNPAVFSVVLVEVSGHAPAKDSRVLARLAAAGLFRLPTQRLATASSDARFAKLNAVFVKNSSFGAGWLDRWLAK